MGWGGTVKGAKIGIGKLKSLFSSSGQDIKKEGLMKIFSEMTSVLFLQYSTECIQTVDGDQSISLKCIPPSTAATPWPEVSSGCTLDLELAAARIQRIHEFERAQWQKGDKVKVRTSIADEIAAMEDAFTLHSCKSCEFHDISQYSVMNMKQSCSMSTDQITKWQNSVSGAIESLVYSRNDVLSGLSSAFGKSSKRDAVNELTNRLNKANYREMESRLYDRFKANQTFYFTGQSASFTGVSQQQIITSGSQLIQDSGFFDTVMTSEEWQIYEKIVSENTTIDDTGAVIARIITSVSDLIDTTLGILVIGVVSLLLLGILILGIYIGFFAKKS